MCECFPFMFMDPLELELCMNGCELPCGAGDQTQALWKNTASVLNC